MSDPLRPRAPYNGWHLDDQPWPRPTPPSQPQGWVDPDPLDVQTQPVDQRVPRHEIGVAPSPHGCAWFGLGMAAGIILTFLAILFAPILDAAPRSSAVIPSLDRAWTVGESGQPRSGAPLPDRPLASQRSDGRRWSEHAAGRPVDGASNPRTVEGPDPSPSEGLIGPKYAAQATYCAPTVVDGRAYCTDWGGEAKLAAVNSFRFGDAPYWVRIERGAAQVDVLVVSFCRCQDRDDRIDLSPSAFKVLAPLSRGRIAVEVERLNWPYEPGGDPPPHPDDDRMRAEDANPTLPPTDSRP